MSGVCMCYVSFLEGCVLFRLLKSLVRYFVIFCVLCNVKYFVDGFLSVK